MKILESEKVYLLWYFSEFEKWETLKLRNQGEDHFDILAPFWTDVLCWMESEDLLTIGKMSFENSKQFKENYLDNLKKIKNEVLASKVTKNSFSLVEFHEIFQEYLKIQKKEILRGSLIYYANKPEIKIKDFTKIKTYLDKYVSNLLNEYKIIRGDSLLQTSLVLNEKILLESYKNRLIWMYGKDATETINKELKKDIKDINTLTIFNEYETDYRFFLPSMIYMENKKVISIHDITYDLHSYWYWVEFKILSTEERLRDENRIWKIECTKVSAIDNTFTIYINEKYSKPITLKKSGSGLILYEIAHNKVFKKDLNENSIKDHLDYFRNKKRGSVIYKDFPEIDNTKILKSVKTNGKIKVIAMPDVDIRVKSE